MDHEIYTLSNGIRILFRPTDSPISHCCLLINAGARDELEGKAGLAHFIEHLLFKGTEKRNTNQILNRLEVVGADLNAYTTKEYTCLHASFLNEHLERSMDLLQDIAFFSTFPAEEMEKEKGVIIDEIQSYEDQPEEAIADEFEHLLFEGHSLGENILGTPESVEKFDRSDIADFIGKTYNTSEIVFAVTGNYSSVRLFRMAEKYFGIIKENHSKKLRLAPSLVSAKSVSVAKPINQTHCMLGTRAYSFHDPKKYALLLLNSYLGGNGMSSVLNLEIREKYGIAYTVESSYTAFSDTGIFSVYYGTDAEKARRAEKLVLKEFKKVRENKLGRIKFHQAKQKFTGQIALGEENRMGVLISMAKSLLDFNKIDSLEEVFSQINKISPEEFLEVANEILDPKQLNFLNYLPE